MMEEYRLVAGWTKYRSATSTRPEAGKRLFDTGVAQVRADLKDDKDPPDNYHITKYNWNEGRWVEQPVTQYSTKDLSEDFAETIMAFLKFPDVLKARSPRRFAFIEAHRAKWLRAPEATSAAPLGSDTKGTINTPPPAPSSGPIGEELLPRARE